MFDKVVMIHLASRPARLARFESLNWPLGPVEIFNAIDGHKTGAPPKLLKSAGYGAWGCLRSHITVLEASLMQDHDTTLVLEDDVCWPPEMEAKVRHFLEVVPPDWQMLMLGGEHIARPIPVSPDVVRCHYTIRFHAYAVKKEAIPSILMFLYGCVGHADQCVAKWQKTHLCYAPIEFLIGQASGVSDITGLTVVENYWNGTIEVPSPKKKRIKLI